MNVKCPHCGRVLGIPDGAQGAQGKCAHCQQPFEIAKAERVGLAPGDVLGGCCVEAVIGRGGMAVVYRATQVSLNRPVALKVLAPHLARRKQFVERFGREAAALAQLSHPNIVGIVGKGVEGDTYYIAMELVEGESLRARLRRQGKLPLDEAAQLIGQIAAGLEYAHGHGILHRDIKPENILISMEDAGASDLASPRGSVGTSMRKGKEDAGASDLASPRGSVGTSMGKGKEDAGASDVSSPRGSVGTSMGKGGVPKLADFGIARMVGADAAGQQRLTLTQTQMGSAHYMAPEQMHDAAKADHRADIYALGVLLYESLTGQLPIGQFEPASRLVPGTPVAVDRLIAATLAASPEKRLQTVAQFRAMLERAALPGVPTLIRRRPPIRPAARRKSHAVPIAMGAAAAIAGTIALFALPSGNRGTPPTQAVGQPSPDPKDVGTGPRARPSPEEGVVTPATKTGTREVPSVKKPPTVEPRGPEAGEMAKWDAIKADAKKLIDAGKLDEAAKLFDGAKALPLDGIADLIAEQMESIESTKSTLRKATLAAYARKSDEVWALFKERKYAEADKLLADLAASLPKVSHLREGIAQHLKADQEAARLLKEFWAAVEKGLAAKAGQFVSFRGAAGGTLVTVQDGTATVKTPEGDPEPRRVQDLVAKQALVFAQLKPDERGRLTEAVFRIAEAEDPPLAEKALDAAGNPPGLTIYRDRLASLTLGAQEAAARKAWREIEALAKAKPTKAEAQRLLGLLDAFGQTHGKTKEFAALRDKLPDLRAQAQAAAETTAKQPPTSGKWVSLFDGKTLDRWQTVDGGAFAGHGTVDVTGGRLVLGRGRAATAVHWDGPFPTEDYEVAVEVSRSEGRGDFCTMTFPVGQSACTLIVPHILTSSVGLELVDGKPLNENGTAKRVDLKNDTWYRVRLRVTEAKVEGWIDDESILEVARGAHRLEISPPWSDAKPFSIGSWESQGIVRSIRLRLLGADAAKAQRTAAVGGDTGASFEDQVRGQGYLVGFRHTAGSFGDDTVVQSPVPVYRTPKGLCGGSVHGNGRNRPAGAHETIAKTGYAVGALVMKGGAVLDGFKIIFMRVKGDSLDPRDRYESEWIGGPAGGPEITQGGRGRQIVGIHGRDGLLIDALGLIERTP